MLDWQKIQKECPKAYQRLIINEKGEQQIMCNAFHPDPLKWMGENDFDFGEGKPFETRDLFDHFDEVGVTVCIGKLLDSDGWRLWINDTFQDVEANDRRAAEKAAFEKAFEIHEQILNA